MRIFPETRIYLLSFNCFSRNSFCSSTSQLWSVSNNFQSLSWLSLFSLSNARSVTRSHGSSQVISPRIYDNLVPYFTDLNVGFTALYPSIFDAHTHMQSRRPRVMGKSGRALEFEFIVFFPSTVCSLSPPRVPSSTSPTNHLISKLGPPRGDERAREISLLLGADANCSRGAVFSSPAATKVVLVAGQIRLAIPRERKKGK